VGQGKEPWILFLEREDMVFDGVEGGAAMKLEKKLIDG